MESVFAFNGFSDWALKTPKNFFGDFFVHLHDHFIPHHRNNYYPHIFSHRLTSFFAVLLVAVKIFSLAFLSFSQVQSVYSSSITAENIISLTNQSRGSFGLKALAGSSVLAKAAQSKANDMAEKGYFSHTSPGGRLPWDFIQAAGYNYLLAGENLAVNFSQAESVNEAWLNSPSHKDNILNKNFEEIGIGIAEGVYAGKNTVFVVQMFGTSAQQKITLKDEPTIVNPKVVPAPAAIQTSLAPSENISNEARVTEPKDTSFVIENSSFNIQGSQLVVSVKASEQASKVLVVYGQKAIMLMPKDSGVWVGNLSLASLVPGQEKLIIKAFDIQGKQVTKSAAIFAGSIVSNYNIFSSGQVAGKQVQVFGKSVDLQDFQNRFYLLFVAVVLTCLILAIAIRRHVQHLSIVANGSFVAILAILLWMG